MKHYIYGLYSTEDGAIRYVGETTQDIKDRLSAHKSESLHQKKKSHKCNWIRKVYKCGFEVKIILIDTATENDWEDKEIYWINEYRTKNIGLTNQLPGGNSGGIGAKPKDYLSYNDARQLMIENDIKTLKEYHEFYKKLKNDGKNILPASAEQYYSLRGEWVGSFHFFNKIGLTDKEKHNNFLTYEEAKNYIKNFNFKDRNEYREYVRREKIPFLPVIPENTYKKDFVSMYDFLGKEKPQLLSYEEAKEFSIKNGFKTSREYFAYRKNNKNCMLPQHPERDYREWVSWADFLETNNKRKPYKKRGE